MPCVAMFWAWLPSLPRLCCGSCRCCCAAGSIAVALRPRLALSPCLCAGAEGGGSGSEGASSSDEKKKTKAVPFVLMPPDELAAMDDEVERVIMHR